LICFCYRSSKKKLDFSFQSSQKLELLIKQEKKQ
jgi:hypothetical protein